MTRCSQPGCPGTIVDGYCDVCGSPGPVEASPAAPSAVSADVTASPPPMARPVPSPGAPARLLTATATSAVALQQPPAASRPAMIKRRYLPLPRPQPAPEAPAGSRRPRWAPSVLPAMVPRSPNGCARALRGFGRPAWAPDLPAFRRRP